MQKRARHGPRMPQTTDTEHMTGEAIQLGAIASVDHANATCTVQLGNMVTGELPWITQRAGGVRSWSPPIEGEQCVLLAPEGDVANGLVVLGLYSDAHPAPANDPDVVALEFPDGASIRYNHATHTLAASLPAGSAVTIDATDIAITGNVAITGDVSIIGTATASEDMMAAGISLKNHKHGGVQAGGAQTGGPA